MRERWVFMVIADKSNLHLNRELEYYGCESRLQAVYRRSRVKRAVRATSVMPRALAPLPGACVKEA